MRELKNIKRVIIKIGSSSLVNKNLSINEPVLVSLMHQFKKLIDNNIHPCLVTSGAVALGMFEMGLTKKPTEMSIKQAAAAVGQAKLMEYYNKCASIYNLKLGQILLNHDDFQIRKRMNYLSNTLDSMFKNNIIPVINENDALSVDEIKVGDNDTLSSLLVPLIDADLLILFSDIDGLYDKNPKLYNDAKLISNVYEINEEIKNSVSDTTTNVGTGGMVTKLNAAIISTSSNCDMIICNSNKIEELYEIVNGNEIGTIFYKNKLALSQRDIWIAYQTNSSGSIIVDDGLVLKLKDKKVSILPSGIIDVNNEFYKDDIIEIKDKNNNLVAKGISNYSSYEISLIMGKNTKEINKILGKRKKLEVVHADDLVVIGGIYGYFIK